MDQLYLGYTGWEYLFMITWIVATTSFVYAYLRIQDLKEQLEYHKSLTTLVTRKT